MLYYYCKGRSPKGEKDMKEIELLEKLISVQEMHIELINDYNDLQNSYNAMEKLKNERIQNLFVTTESQEKQIAMLEKENAELNTIIDKFKELVSNDIIDAVYDDDEQ